MSKVGEFEINGEFLNIMKGIYDKHPDLASYPEDYLFSLLRTGIEQREPLFVSGKRVANALILTSIDGSEYTLIAKKTKEGANHE